MKPAPVVLFCQYIRNEQLILVVLISTGQARYSLAMPRKEYGNLANGHVIIADIMSAPRL